MRSDLARQLANVVTFFVVLAVNGAANALPINGQMTKDISDRFSVYVIPAGYVFAIWGLIYITQAMFTVWQALPRNREDATLRSLGWLPVLAGSLNVTWLLLFHYNQFVLALPMIVAFLVTLIAIHLRLWARRAELTGTRYWMVRAPFAIYVGWLTVATIANTAQTLQFVGFNGFGIDGALIAAVVLAVGLLIAARFVTEFRDVTYGLVIVWAYAGIVVKESATPVVAGTAGIAALIVLTLAAVAWARNRGWLRGGAMASGSTPAAA